MSLLYIWFSQFNCCLTGTRKLAYGTKNRDYGTRNHDYRIRNRDAPCTMNMWMNVGYKL